jgi:NAD(P)-dependent dehydrogenase (short-subunit alcohol dehydrogenase family)
MGQTAASQFATYPSLRGRVVVVTGGASGIGESVVEHFARQSSQVVFLDIQDAAAEKLIERINRIDRLGAAGFSSPVFLHCDLTDMGAVKASVTEIERRFQRIDVLINNGGNDTRHTVEEVTPEYWDRCMNINLKQQFFVAQSVIPSMRQAGQGTIINMSSIAWLIPSTGLPVYVTAKAAVVGLTRTLAHELGAHNIRVNCVLPGAILTDRQRKLWLTDQYKAEVLGRQALKRLLLPEEVARLVLFLAANDSSGITNQSYIVDGGWV